VHGEHEADVDMLSEFDELNASNKQFYERLDCEQKGFLGIVCGSHFLVGRKITVRCMTYRGIDRPAGRLMAPANSR
jgi:hypothetical protein